MESLKAFMDVASSMWEDFRENLISLKLVLEKAQQNLEELWAKFMAS